MNLIYRIMSDDIIEALGLTLIHSLWQGALIALVLGILMLATRKFTSVTRYFLAVAASLFMLICPAYTFIKNYSPDRQGKNSAYVNQFSDAPVLKKVVSTYAESDAIVADNRIIKLKSVQFKDFFNRHFPIIVTIWFAGIIFFTLKFIGALAYTQRLKYYRISQIPEEWQKKTRKLCEMLNIKKAVKIYESALAIVPMVIGFIKPIILLPVSAFTGLSSKQLESIIVHELAHILRRDYLLNILQSVIEILFFYHPAVWWINNVIRTERENCCDDIAIAQTGDSTNYARALANIQEHLLIKESLALAVSGHKNKLLKRIKRLLNQPKMKTNFIEGFTASCIILLGIFAIVLNANAITERTIDNKLKKSEKEPVLSESVLTFPALPGEPDSAVIPGDAEDELFKLEKVSDKAKTEEKKQMKKEEKAKTEKEKEMKEEEKAKTEEEKQMKEKDKAKIEKEKQMKKEEKAKTEKEKEMKKEDKAKTEKEKEMKEEEKEIEVETLSADDVADEIAKGIERGLLEMNIDLIVDEAIAGIQAGLNEMNINAIIREAIKGANGGLRNVDIDMIINEALIGVQAAMEGMDLNAIIGEALNGVKKGLKETEVEKIKEDYENDDDKDADCESFRGNAEHLANLKMGTSYWNKWRAENSKEKVDLRGACLHETALKDMNLSNASLENIDLGEAALDGTDFTGANLTGANLKEAALNQVVFKGAIMEGINLKEVSLHNLDLSEAILTNANLKETSMNSVDLSKADLRYANLKETSMNSVDLSKADLRYANLKEASLNKVNFSGADLRGAILTEASINDCKFKGAIIDSTTLLPPGFNIDAE
jgi:uncharacterized protein YjbI with pentapeptide repeats/beta-lactamase regulating signal transducer with metallopeptidase domain